MTGGELFPIVKTAASDTGKRLQDAVGATLADVWQGVVGDKVAAWRLRNAAAMNEKLGKQLAKAGQSLNLDKVPERIAFAWFDKATQSDEPEIQELFAKLLANAADGNEDALKKRNIELVSSLTPDDAKLLEIIAKRYRAFMENSWAGNAYTFSMKLDTLFYKRLREEEGFEDVTSIDALQSLGILRLQSYSSVDGSAIAAIFEVDGYSLNINPYADAERMLITTHVLHLTKLGVSLVNSLFPRSDS